MRRDESNRYTENDRPEIDKLWYVGGEQDLQTFEVSRRITLETTQNDDWYFGTIHRCFRQDTR